MLKISIIIFTLISLSGFSQEFNYFTEVSKVEENGFYKIKITPEICALMNNDFSDIRLYNSSDIEVPYLLKQEKRKNEKELFQEYDIIEKTHYQAKKYTRLVIHNKNKTEIDNIVLRISNADVKKHLKLNGSYNNKTWYVLKDNYYYNSIYNNTNVSEIRVLDFPKSNYEYYELLIDDFYDKSINILQAGHYNTINENGKYTKLNINSYVIGLDNENKQTVISIPTNNYIDKICFEISDPKYYLRNTDLFLYETKTIRERTKKRERNLGHFNLISNSNNSYALDKIRVDTLYVRIKDNDNSRLSISDIKLYQLNSYLIAELDSTENYHIKFSNKNTTKPIYDLQYFKDSIPSKLSQVGTSQIQKVVKQGTTKGNLNISSYWLWGIILIVAGGLSYMSYKMINDMKNEK